MAIRLSDVLNKKKPRRLSDVLNVAKPAAPDMQKPIMPKEGLDFSLPQETTSYDIPQYTAKPVSPQQREDIAFTESAKKYGLGVKEPKVKAPFVPKSSMVDILKNRWKIGKQVVNRGNIGAKGMWGGLTPEETIKQSKGLPNYKKLGPEFSLKNPETWIPGAVGGAAELLPYMKETISRGAKTGLETGLGFAGVATLAGQAGPQIATPEELITVPTAGVMGYSVGQAYGMLRTGMDIEGGNMYIDMLERGVSPEVAKPIAMVGGLTNAIIERLQVATLAKRIPGFKQFVTGSLNNPVVKKTLYKVVKNYVKDVGAEVAEEEIQEIVALTGEHLAAIIEQSKGKDIKAPTTDEWITRLSETLKAAPAMAVLSLPGAGVSGYQTISQRKGIPPVDTGKPPITQIPPIEPSPVVPAKPITPTAPAPVTPMPSVSPKVGAPEVTPVSFDKMISFKGEFEQGLNLDRKLEAYGAIVKPADVYKSAEKYSPEQLKALSNWYKQRGNPAQIMVYSLLDDVINKKIPTPPISKPERLSDVLAKKAEEKYVPTSIRESLIKTVNKWSSGRTDKEWGRLGRIFQEQFKSAKTEINALAKKDDTLSIKERIALSRTTTFDEIRKILEAKKEEGGIKFKKAEPTTLIEEARKYDKVEGFVGGLEKQGKLVYHGTNQEFDVFDKGLKGQDIKAESAKEGYWFTESKEEAQQYADYSAKRSVPNQVEHEKKVDKLLLQIKNAEVARNFNRAESLTLELEDLEATAIQAEPSGQRIIEVVLDMKNPMFVDASNFERFDHTEIIEKAKKNNYDGIIIKNISDSPRGNLITTQYMVFNKSQIKTKSDLTSIWNKAHAKLKAKGQRLSDVLSKQYKPQLQDKLRNLNKELFGDRDINFTEKMLDNVAKNKDILGYYRNGMINIVKGTPEAKSTFYHEAGHKYYDMFSTAEEKKAILEEGRKRWKIDDNSLLEEKIMDRFEKFAKTRKGVFGKIWKFFDKIMARIKAYLGKESKIKKFYEDILGGKAKVSKAKPTAVTKYKPQGKLPVIPKEPSPVAKMMEEAKVDILEKPFTSKQLPERIAKVYEHIEKMKLKANKPERIKKLAKAMYMEEKGVIADAPSLRKQVRDLGGIRADSDMPADSDEYKFLPQSVKNKNGMTVDEMASHLESTHPGMEGNELREQLMYEPTRKLQPLSSYEEEATHIIEDMEGPIKIGRMVQEDTILKLIASGNDVLARKALIQGKKIGVFAQKEKFKDVVARAKGRKDERQKIKKMVDDINNINVARMSPQEAEPIKALINDLDLVKRQKPTMLKLAKTQQFIESNPNAEMPDYMLEKLSRLDKRNLNDITVDELETIHHSVMHYAHLNKVKNEIKVGREIRRADKVLNDSIGEMKPPKAVKDNIVQSQKSKVGRIKKTGKLITDTFGIRHDHYDLIVESLAGKNSTMDKVLYTGIKEGINTELSHRQNAYKTFQKDLDIENFQKKHKIGNIADWQNERVKVGKFNFARGERMSLYRHSLNENNLRHILEGGFGLKHSDTPYKPIKITEDELTSILNDLKPAELEFAGTAVSNLFNNQGKALGDTFYKKNGYPLPLEDSYYPIEVMKTTLPKELEAESILEELKHKFVRVGLSKGMLKSRKESKLPIYLNNIAYDINKSVLNASAYVGLEMPLSNASKLLYNKSFRAQMANRYGIRTWDEIEKGLRDIAGDYKSYSTVEELALTLKNKLSTAILGFNPFVMAKQILSYPLYNVYVKSEYLMQGFADYITHPIETSNRHKINSPGYLERVEGGYSRDVADVFKTGAEKRVYKGKASIPEKLMSGIKLFDQNAVIPGMQGAVLQVLAEFKIGKLSYEVRTALDIADSDIAKLSSEDKMKLAYKFADYVTERTQPMFSPEHRSSLSRGAPIEKLATQFTSFTNQALNLIRRTYREARRTKDPKIYAKLLKVLFLLLVVNTAGVVAIDDVRDRMYKRKKRTERGLPQKFGEGVLDSTASYFYFIRDIERSVKSKVQRGTFVGYDISVPVLGAIDTFGDMTADGIGMLTEKDFAKRKKRGLNFIDKSLELLLLTQGLPYRTPKKLGKTLLGIESKKKKASAPKQRTYADIMGGKVMDKPKKKQRTYAEIMSGIK